MFNEESGARSCVSQVSSVLNGMPKNPQLIVVEDGSIDSTKEILIDLKSVYKNLVVVSHPENLGYGSALNSGIQKAIDLGVDYVLFMDSDLTNSPKDIPRFYKKMLEGYDVIKATRYSDGGATAGVPLSRLLISKIGNLIARLLFGLPVTDCTNGFRAVKTSLLRGLCFYENGFPIIMEELYLLRDKASSYSNIPVTLSARTVELRKTSFNYSYDTYKKYLKYPALSFFSRIHFLVTTNLHERYK
jgi:glycosyltransferase involved in cell wall biosynthesis